MGYYDIAQMGHDPALTSRLAACAAQEQPGADPYLWVTEHALQLTSQPGWDAAWASALAAGNADPGKDPAVISDPMILSGVQAVLGGAE
jgi:hypothetical protein